MGILASLADLTARVMAERQRAEAQALAEARAREEAEKKAAALAAGRTQKEQEAAQHAKQRAEAEAQAAAAMRLSARGSTRVLRVARTIADLAGARTTTVAHVAEAMQYRRALRVS